MKLHAEARKWYIRICIVLLTLIATGLFFVEVFLVDQAYIAAQSNDVQHMIIIPIYIILYYFVTNTLHGFDMGYERKSYIVASQIISLIITNMLAFLNVMLVTGIIVSCKVLIFHWLCLLAMQMIVVILACIGAINLYWHLFLPIQMLEVYGDYKNDMYTRINDLKHKYHITQRVHYSADNIKEIITGFDAVLINDIPSGYKNKLLKICFDLNKSVYFVPKISDILVKSAEELNVLDVPLLACNNQSVPVITRIVKRFFDLVLSALSLVILSPLFLVISVAIKLEDGGTVFFRQERCTIGGKRFMILKFRSMTMDAETGNDVHPTEIEDKRITKVGRIIRTTRIDEIPQFLNILKGEMSLVGPRPERVEHVEKYTQEIPEFSFRNKFKAGLTGYAQVYGKYNTTALDKLKLDLVYIMKFSLLLDFEIMIETLHVLFMKESTEGFSKERAEEINLYHQKSANGIDGIYPEDDRKNT